MNRIRTINGIFVLLFISLAAFSSSAQELIEPFQQAAQRGAAAMRLGDFDAAIEFYTEAINLFPKIDAFTPQNKKIKLAGDKFIETPYKGLGAFYLSRAKAHLNKRDLEAADNDYLNAFTVLKYEMKGNLDKAKSYRRNVDIEKEKKNGRASSHNSDLVRAVFAFSNVQKVSEEAKWLNRRRKEYYMALKIPLSPDKQNIPGFDEVDKYREEAFWGMTEAYVVSMIEVGNKAHSFWALKSADEFVAAFPMKIEAYRLRAKVNQYLGRNEAALADEQKVKELSGQK